MTSELPQQSKPGGLSPLAAINIFRKQKRNSSSKLSPYGETESVITDDSKSSGSLKKRGSKGSFKELINKLRSSSTSIALEDDDIIQLQESDFKQIDDWKVGFDRYNQLVTTIVSRNQTYPSENFSNLTNILTKNCGGRFVHGLPEAMFDFSLLWCPAGPGAHKTSDEPTWSWTGWDGPVNFPFDPTNAPDLARKDGPWFKSEIFHYGVGPEKAQYTLRRDKDESLRTEFPPYFHAPFGKEPCQESNTLRFKAYTVAMEEKSFDIEQLQYEGKEIPASQLLNNKGQHCGVIMEYQSRLVDPNVTGPYDLVLLSRNLRKEPNTNAKRPVISTVHPPGTPIWDENHFVWHQEIHDYDEQVFEKGPWKMLNVMMIQWLGADRDIARRVAIGRIHEDAWKEYKPVFETIALR